MSANSAWLAEWLAGEVRHQTGWTLAQIDDGHNQVRLDLVMPADVVARLAETERDAALKVGRHITDTDSLEDGQG